MADAVRLDNWLGAAGFFRTRANPKAAIEGGKVHCNGQRAKAAKTVALGDQLTIRQGF
ncbi:MAG: S4 domain-containing protein, partial [Pseudomonadota bacterium]|nr:S4 domain-containing protein [Pseudomonadota bacterium]